MYIVFLAEAVLASLLHIIYSSDTMCAAYVFYISHEKRRPNSAI